MRPVAAFWRGAGRCRPQDPLPSADTNVVIRRDPVKTMRWSGTEGVPRSAPGPRIIRNDWDPSLTNGEDAGRVSLAHSLDRRGRREGRCEVRVDLQLAIKSQNRQDAEHTSG